jgi:hypothetical protein
MADVDALPPDVDALPPRSVVQLLGCWLQLQTIHHLVAHALVQNYTRGSQAR